MQQAQQQASEINQNFDQTAVMRRKQTPAVPSGFDKINYIYCQRRGSGDNGRATFIAEFGPGAAFPTHSHPFGEEVYVLQGTLSDAFGDYHKGSYIRQAINSSHTPYAAEGCKLFVKMCQMPLNSTQKLLLDTKTLNFQHSSEGISQTTLYESEYQKVLLYQIKKNKVLKSDELQQITEIFVIEGVIKSLSFQQLQEQCWVRIPKSTKYEIEAKVDSKIYVKIGKGIVRGRKQQELLE